MRILLTGATGYVGGRLLRALPCDGREVRCLARRPAELRARIGQRDGPEPEIVGGDVLQPETLAAAFDRIDVAYYLVHSMGARGDFAERDRTAAENFARAAEAAGVRRIVYLGGLGGDDSELSPHLRSRQEVGAILAAGPVQSIELRASIILGSGSLSFEMIRALVERLPVMITPRWVRSLAQPIAIEDVIAFLTAAAAAPVEGDRVFEIGGADQVSYLEIMREYARQRGLRRLMLPVPVLSPRVSSWWLDLITPVYAAVGRKLIDSVRNDTVVRDASANEVFGVRPRGVEEAIRRALVNEDLELAETRWSDALSSLDERSGYGGVRYRSRIVDSRTRRVSCSVREAFAPIQRIGGANGWYFLDALWTLRGFLDRLLGGPGMRRGRRHPEVVTPGEALDFWRVEAFEPDRLLRLRAEMRLPGRAWLQFEVEEDEGGACIRQTAEFDPRGLPGLLYWYGIHPLHALIFAGMLRNIARAGLNRPGRRRSARGSPSNAAS